jgi:phosphoadenosine phosphosulfate reductase
MDRWALVSREALLVATSAKHLRRVDEARRAIDAHLAASPEVSGYHGVSWGKDSVVVAHLLRDIEIPLAWVRIKPLENPDNETVRDAYFGLFPQQVARYEEEVVWCRRGAETWHATGTLERGFAAISERHGDRHISGVRGQESSVRKLTVMRNGTVSATTCRPLAHWTGMDVFAYLLKNELPIHPAYGYTMDGMLDPTRLRVDTLGCRYGDGMGRREWEWRYYGETLKAAERALRGS